MAFAFGGAGALLKAFVPVFPRLMSRRQIAAAAQRWGLRDAAGAPDVHAPVPIAALSAEAEAALATLDLPPDGPIDPDAAPRARLSPEVAARNFVRWAQALDLDGGYATRSIYALYCEFSEVDGRPPVRDTRFLPALAETPGIAAARRGKDKACRLWRWTIAPAEPTRTPEPAAEPGVEVWTHEPAPAPRRGPEAPQAARAPEAAALAPPHAPATTTQPPSPALATTAPAAPQAPAGDVSQSEAAPAVGAVREPPASASCGVPAAASRKSRRAAKLQPPAVSPAIAVDDKPAILVTAANASAPAKPIKSTIILPRFVADADHPFSPAALREREKHARRLRLYAAASRKQRGALRRAA